MRVLRLVRSVCIVSLCVSAAAGKGYAQEHVDLTAELLFYGDNTEFRNPFREGETIFGAAVRGGARIVMNERASIVLGVFANQRFGSEDAFEQVRPVIALTLKRGAAAFTFGTLTTPRAGDPAGPDRTGPHGLLPPLQAETLAFERPYEAGLQWTHASPRLRHDAWINWQRLNTPAHRERFDVGVNTEMRPSGLVHIPLQLHIVHEGGQLFAAGPVADSIAAAVGVKLSGQVSHLDRASIETYALASRYTPDRERPDRTRAGAGLLARAAAERGGWRGHLLMFRGDDFIKAEGDPNYMSLRRDGTRYRGVRDYAEAGVTRTFRVAPGLLFAAAARLHRVEQHYEYSYRLLGTAALGWRLR
jgi:hypothetical protein